MTLNLRDRRRLETAREIQQATLKLAMAGGLDGVATEAIAEAAGVSKRTFFNYYPNKESAAIGTPPSFRAEDMAALRAGGNALATDIKAFLDKHMAALAENETTLRMVRKVVHANIKASSVLDRFQLAKRDELAECLRARVNDEQVALALATNAMACTSQAIHLWENEESVPLAKALDIIWTGQIAAARLLAAPLD
jgi:AcrR family transcriptional regulator